MRALGPHKLEFRLDEATSYLPALLAHTISLPARLDKIQAFGDKWTSPENLVVLGPYKLVTWKDELITLVANDRYHSAKSQIQKFSFRVVHDDATALRLYQSGRLDLVYGPPRMEWGTLRKTDEFKIFPTIRVMAMTFNVLKPPFDQPKVWQALR